MGFTQPSVRGNDIGRMTFTTHNSIADCNAKLVAGIDSGWWAYIWGHKEILGTIEAARFQLRVRHLSRRGINSYSPVFYGQLTVSNNVTLIQGSFSHYSSRAFFIFWFSVIGLFTLGSVLLYILAQLSVKDLERVLIFIVVLIGACVACEKLDQRSFHNNEGKIVAFLKDKLEASEIALEATTSDGPSVPPVFNK